MEKRAERIVREQERRIITGLSRSQSWRLEQEGLFPKRRKIGKCAVGWLMSEIDAWIASRKMASTEMAEEFCRNNHRDPS